MGNLKKYLYPFILLALSIAVFFINYQPGTFLIGWDNLFPEFNFWLNLKRTIFAVWQEYRGLGLYDGMGHAANLVEVLIAGLFSLLLPLNLVRYVIVIGLHFLGGLGFYLFLRHEVKDKEASLLGSIFYMFNIGIIQQFFAPLESFGFHFMALPWVFYLGICYIEDNSKKNLFMFCLLSLFVSAQGFVPTLFMTFMIAFCFLLWTDLTVNKHYKRFLVLFVTTLCINAFWLLPFLNGVPTNAPVIKHARINQFSSEEVYARNVTRGGLLNVIQMKGFMLDTYEFDAKKNDVVHFMKSWDDHSRGVAYIACYAVIIALAIVGLSKLRHRNRFWAYGGMLLVSFSFLGVDIPVFRDINLLWRSIMPIFAEVLRFPFTKFITIFAFSLSIFVALGISILREKIGKAKGFIAVLCVVSVLFYISLPVWRGNFFSPLLKKAVPTDYFRAFSYLDKQEDKARIALLPTFTFWSWQVRSWGYVGSDFIWFGIKQPILVRAFDPWSKYNEQAYNELSYAINSNRRDLLSKALYKYNINYLLIDEYLVNNLALKPLNFDQLKRFLDKTPGLKREKTFNKLVLYKTSQPIATVYKLDASTTAKIYPGFEQSHQDQAFLDSGDYISVQDASQKDTIYYPFRSFFTEKSQDDMLYNVTQKKDELILEPLVFSKRLDKTTLEIPSMFENEHLIPFEFTSDNKGSLILKIIYPSFRVNNRSYQPQEEVAISLDSIQTPRSLVLVDNSNKTIKIGQKGFLINGIINSFIVKDGSEQETVELDTRQWKKTPFSFNFNSEEVQNLTVSVPIFANPFAITDTVPVNQYSAFPHEFELPVFSRSAAHAEVKRNDKKEAVMSAQQGNIEIIYSNNDMPHQGSYLFLIDYDHMSGLSINFSLNNPQQNRFEVDARLSKDRDRSIVLLPKTEDFNEGYGVHLTVKSVGTETARVNLKSIQAYPFPHETLKRARFIRSGFQTVYSQSRVPFDDGQGGFWYGSDFVGIDKDMFVVLNEAFDPGWHAYIHSSDNFFTRSLPFLFGRELEKTIVNNWQTGWKLPKAYCEGKIHCFVVMVFVPQYLQFIGYMALVIAFLSIFFLAKRLQTTDQKTEPAHSIKGRMNNLFFSIVQSKVAQKSHENAGTKEEQIPQVDLVSTGTENPHLKKGIMLFRYYGFILCLFLFLGYVVFQLKLYLDDFYFLYPALIGDYVSHFKTFFHFYGMFRPFMLVYYYLIFSLYLLSPEFIHIVSLMFYIVAIYFVYKIMQKQGMGKLSFALTLAIAALPFWVEGYAWIAATTSVIVIFLFLFQVFIIEYFYPQKKAYIAIILLQFISSFMYESTIFMPISLALLWVIKSFDFSEWFTKARTFILHVAVFGLPTFLYVVGNLLFPARIETRIKIINLADMVGNWIGFGKSFQNLFVKSEFFAIVLERGWSVIVGSSILFVCAVLFALSLWYKVKHLQERPYSFNVSVALFWLLSLFLALFPLSWQRGYLSFRTMVLPSVIMIILVGFVLRFLYVRYKLHISRALFSSAYVLLGVVCSIFFIMQIGMIDIYNEQYVKDVALSKEIADYIKKENRWIGLVQIDDYPLNTTNTPIYGDFSYSVFQYFWAAEYIYFFTQQDWVRLSIHFVDGKSSQAEETVKLKPDLYLRFTKEKRCDLSFCLEKVQ